ncbi:MAG: TlyA family RNA methyltransferase [Polyangiaceae bacterium]|nr:TlyA family RNA methyltransferase [Polyangiaceae bacterium]
MKRRADQLLVERGLAESRARAQALILAGRVFSGEARVEKPGTPLRDEAPLEVRGGSRFVSRGGDKLAGALEDLGVEPTGAICADVGASTGGFTDCLLQHGAAAVYAIDVGQGQLADKLVRDPRVVVRDKTNARHLEARDFERTLDLLVVDASFIGLGKLLPAFTRVLGPGARLLALIKPQFEVGRDEARRHQGVIRDPELRGRAVSAVLAEIAAAGFVVLGEAVCRVPGPRGNVEHFVLARRS